MTFVGMNIFSWFAFTYALIYLFRQNWIILNYQKEYIRDLCYLWHTIIHFTSEKKPKDKKGIENNLNQFFCLQTLPKDTNLKAYIILRRFFGKKSPTT